VHCYRKAINVRRQIGVKRAERPVHTQGMNSGQGYNKSKHRVVYDVK
jgi:hypothetical protein